jgi:threonine synthase
VSAEAVDDAAIRTSIVAEYRRHGLPWCPHTATAFDVYRKLPASERQGRHWIVVATAHAAKFDTIVEPLLGITVPPPPELAALLALPSRFATVPAELPAVAAHL